MTKYIHVPKQNKNAEYENDKITPTQKEGSNKLLKGLKKDKVLDKRQRKKVIELKC